MNLEQLQNDLRSVPDNALVGYVTNPNGMVPSYLALAELTRRKEIRSSAPAQEGAAEKPSIAQQEVAAAQPEGGLGSLPVSDDMFTAAEGGIVGYAEGDTVAYNRALRQSFLPSAMSLTGSALDVLNPSTYVKRGLGALGSSIYDRTLVADPENPGKVITRGELLAREQETNRRLGATERGNLALAPGETFKTAPYYGERQNLVEGEFSTTPAPKFGQRENLMVPEGSFDFSKAAVPTAPDLSAIQGAAGSTRTKGAPTASPAPAGLSAIKAFIPDDFSGAYEAAIPQITDARVHAGKFREMMGEDPFQARAAERLAAMEEKARVEEERAPWMALAEAGFGMAAGTSPFALQNIAAGGMKGIESLVKAKDKATAAADKRFALEADLAKARRAEQIAEGTYGLNSEQADKAAKRTAEKEALTYKADRSAKIADAKYKAQIDNVEAQQREKQLSEIARHNKATEGIQSESNRISKSSIAQSKQLALYEKALDNARAEVTNSAKMTGKEGMMTEQEYNAAVRAKYLANLKALGLPPLDSDVAVPEVTPSAISTPDQKAKLRSLLFGK